MPKKVKLVDYLAEDELKQKYRTCRDRVESRRWHLLWKISQSWTIKDSAAAVGISYEYAREIVRKYNVEGIKSVANKRRKVKAQGRPALLNSEQLVELATALKTRPSDGGIWTGSKVARWIEQETGKNKVWNQRGWDYLKKCNYSWKIPRPKHRKADPIEQQKFKQRLPQLIQQLKQKYHHSSVQLWFMDEHRVGLKPIIRRTWTLINWGKTQSNSSTSLRMALCL